MPNTCYVRLWVLKQNVMIKVKLFLEAEKDIPRTNWKKGDKLELINDVFDRNTGVAFWSLDLGWKINNIEVLECEPNKLSYENES